MRGILSLSGLVSVQQAADRMGGWEMSRKTIGQVLLSMGLIALAYVVIKIVLLAYTHSFSIGFDLVGIWRLWGVWIVLWCIVMVTGLFMVRSRNSAT